ncbi:MAG: CysS/YqeB C-terminal domain-containing protein, partial [Sphingopyxis sp.]
ELEFSWEGLSAALTRLKRLVMAVATLRDADDAPVADRRLTDLLAKFDAAMSDDLNTAVALTLLEEAAAMKKIDAGQKRTALVAMDAVLGLDLLAICRADLRVRPKAAAIAEADIEATLIRRKDARAAKDFAASDALRDELIAAGVEVMDGDPLGWDWQLEA